MKLTNKQLRQIIKEELNAVLEEQEQDALVNDLEAAGMTDEKAEEMVSFQKQAEEAAEQLKSQVSLEEYDEKAADRFNPERADITDLDPRAKTIAEKILAQAMRLAGINAMAAGLPAGAIVAKALASYGIMNAGVLLAASSVSIGLFVPIVVAYLGQMYLSKKHKERKKLKMGSRIKPGAL